jgi:hypothetical protein
MHRLSLSFAVALFCVVGLAAAPAPAHHSGAMYDLTKTVTIEGTVKEFAWTNPHVVLWIVTNPKEGQREQTWSLESTSPGNLTRLGWTKHSFNAGDRVKVDLHPLRSGETGGLFQRALFLDTGKEIAMPADFNRALSGAEIK